MPGHHKRGSGDERIGETSYFMVRGDLPPLAQSTYGHVCVSDSTQAIAC